MSLEGYTYYYERNLEVRYAVRSTITPCGETYFMLSDWAGTEYVDTFKRYLIDMCVGRLNSCLERFVRKAVDMDLKEFEVRGPGQVYWVEITEVKSY